MKESNRTRFHFEEVSFFVFICITSDVVKLLSKNCPSGPKNGSKICQKILMPDMGSEPILSSIYCKKRNLIIHRVLNSVSVKKTFTFFSLVLSNWWLDGVFSQNTGNLQFNSFFLCTQQNRCGKEIENTGPLS